MLAALSFCPIPPLLVPELAGGVAAELDGLRAACQEAVRRLLAEEPDELIVTGSGPAPGRFPPGTGGVLSGFGSRRAARLPTGAPLPAGWYGAPLPLPLTLGAWLLEQAGAAVPCSGLVLGMELDAARSATEGPGRRALLVMGDGSARRSEKAPGYVDPRAAGFDGAVAAALAAGDADALRGLDQLVGAELLAAGVPAWRAAGIATAGREWSAELLYDDAPYGVGYLVASWLPA